MENKDARKVMVENSEYLSKFVKSPQYAKSRDIMKMRYKLSLSTQEVAELANMTHNDFIKLEYGSYEELDKYDKVLELLKLLIKNIL